MVPEVAREKSVYILLNIVAGPFYRIDRGDIRLFVASGEADPKGALRIHLKGVLEVDCVPRFVLPSLGHIELLAYGV